MTLQWAILMILVIVTGMWAENQSQTQAVSEYATLDSLSRNFLTYRSAAAGFAQSNPGFSGIPSDSVLNLPLWFVKPLGVSSFITGGTAYTFFNGTAPSGMASKLVDLTQSAAIGVKQSGTLVSPIMGATGITVPVAVPEGAIVAVN